LNQSPHIVASEVILIPPTLPRNPNTKIMLFATSVWISYHAFKHCIVVTAVFLESLHKPIIVDRFWSVNADVHLAEYHERLGTLVREVTHV